MSHPAFKELQQIPGVGPSIARDLFTLGINHVADLREHDPERLYSRINKIRGKTQDRCLLYVFRCAKYFAETKRPDPERLKWWNWSDENLLAKKRKTRARA
jgi:nucleotidyltransferase/DNA polymerase involved in DNA repair